MPRRTTVTNYQLTEADYQHAADVLGAVSSLLDTVDWDALIAVQDRVESAGPILDPMFRDALQSGRLESNGKVLRATRDYLQALREIHTEAQGRGL